jgi:hypothetical protein
MLSVPVPLIQAFEMQLNQCHVPDFQHRDYHKWLRFYLDFCSKYAFEPKPTSSFAPFDGKLQSKGLSETQRQQARRAVAVYYRMDGTVKSPSTPTSDSSTKNTLVSQRLVEPNPALPNQTGLIPTIPEKPLISATDEPLKLTGSNWVAVYERLQAAIKIRHYSKKTWASLPAIGCNNFKLIPKAKMSVCWKWRV